ncbi:bolA-like protein 2 [Leucoraja erinacea]|uniref:bolA-like protein 2 n=1 Tax=Leucoraja erinaceus TaxID=7782 RepID=UPI0024549B46|nr:bolA-like protein 2 [Leucoraja erinacea]
MTELTAAGVRDKLLKELKAEHVEVEDITAQKCSTSFKVLVVAEVFGSKALLQRHRMVNEVLKEEMKSIHALELKTFTLEQWRGAAHGPEVKS